MTEIPHPLESLQIPVSGVLELTDPSNPGEDAPVYRDLSDWVVLQVLSAISKGDLQPGQRIPEAELAERFNVSRSPVRDAVARLVELGVVERRRRRGTFIRTWTNEDRIEVLQILDALIFISVDLSVDRLTDEDIVELKGIVKEVESASRAGTLDPVRELELDARFHLIMAQASGNGRLALLMEELMLPLRLYVRESAEYLEPEFWLRLHGDLLDAVVLGDRDAALACSIRNMEESRRVLIHEAVEDERAE